MWYTIYRRSFTFDYACYLWETALNASHGTSFDNMYDWIGIRAKAGEGTIVKAYITNDKPFH
jgi:hypothetical protein